MECFIVSSLVWEGDFDATVEFSQKLRDTLPIKLVRRGLRGRSTYVASTGTVVRGVVAGKNTVVR